jgi:hypothetical protein
VALSQDENYHAHESFHHQEANDQYDDVLDSTVLVYTGLGSYDVNQYQGCSLEAVAVVLVVVVLGLVGFQSVHEHVVDVVVQCVQLLNETAY